MLYCMIVEQHTSTRLTEHFVRIAIIEKLFISIKFDCNLCAFIKFSKSFSNGNYGEFGILLCEIGG